MSFQSKLLNVGVTVCRCVSYDINPQKIEFALWSPSKLIAVTAHLVQWMAMPVGKLQRSHGFCPFWMFTENARALGSWKSKWERFDTFRFKTMTQGDWAAAASRLDGSKWRGMLLVCPEHYAMQAEFESTVPLLADFVFFLDSSIRSVWSTLSLVLFALPTRRCCTSENLHLGWKQDRSRMGFKRTYGVAGQLHQPSHLICMLFKGADTGLTQCFWSGL